MGVTRWMRWALELTWEECFVQEEDGIGGLVRSRGRGDEYKGQCYYVVKNCQ